jgi:hypothetical protein
MRRYLFLAWLAGAAGCADLARPNPIRVNRDPSGRPDGPSSMMGRDQLFEVPVDGKVHKLPRLNPPGSPNEGMPMRPGDQKR